jgi:hypothetical protein
VCLVSRIQFVWHDVTRNSFAAVLTLSLSRWTTSISLDAHIIIHSDQSVTQPRVGRLGWRKQQQPQATFTFRFLGGAAESFLFRKKQRIHSSTPPHPFPSRTFFATYFSSELSSQRFFSAELSSICGCHVRVALES